MAGEQAPGEMASDAYDGWVVVTLEDLEDVLKTRGWWDEAQGVNMLRYPPPQRGEVVDDVDSHLAIVGLQGEPINLLLTMQTLTVVIKCAKSSSGLRRRFVESGAFEGIRALVEMHAEHEEVLRLGAEALAQLMGRDIPARNVDVEELRFVWSEGRRCGGLAAAGRILQAARGAGDLVGLVRWVENSLDNVIGWWDKAPFRFDAWGRVVGERETEVVSVACEEGGPVVYGTEGIRVAAGLTYL